MQIFSNINSMKETLGKYQLSMNRTNLLRDGDITTCFPVFLSDEMTYVQMKILPRASYLFQRSFHVDVVTTSKFQCSPAYGFNVFAYSGDTKFRCMVLNVDNNGCRAKCTIPTSLDFVVLNVMRLQRNNMDLAHFCEIAIGK